jgi:hypothetical protein
MLRRPLFWIVLVGMPMLVEEANSEPRAASIGANSNRVIAIDVLLEPDATMVAKAEAANARLREKFPKGYTLGTEQVAHISLVHRYVRKKDLPAIESAVARALATDNPLEWELTADGYAYSIWAGVAITSISVERTPKLAWLQKVIVEAVEPFAVKGGTAAAFSTSRELPKIDREIINYVETFVPNAIADKFNPHVTIGVAREDSVKNLKAEPFAKFTFKSKGVAAYQLGSFGTAQKKLWEWRPTNELSK